MIALLIALATIAAACSNADTARITATVAAGEEPYDALGPGDPVAVGVLRLLRATASSSLAIVDTKGTADVSVEPGIYTVQVMTPSSRPACFCGTTVAEINFPRDPLSFEVFYICPD